MADALEVGFGIIAAEAPIGLGIASLDGTLLEANDALAKCLACDDPAELHGRSLRRFHAFPELAADILRERLEEGSNAGIELDIIRADGETIVVRVHARFYELASGTRAVTFSLEDITAHKEARALSAQGHKMEAIVRFAAGVAHDYNNLLTAIIGEARQLLSDLPEASDTIESAAQILKAAKRASTITRRLLVFSKSEIARTEIVDLNHAVREQTALLEEKLPHDVALLPRLEEDTGNLRIDPAHVRQILMNLVTNARDALPAGGRVVIETSRVSAPQDTEGIDFDPPVPDGEYVSLAVGDNGIGMNKETARRIFDPFFTTKPLGGGAGLGLTTVYGHVLRANGHVSVLSAPALGTLVRLLFPATDEAIAEVDRSSKGSSTVGAEQRTILVVDDEPPVLRVMSRVLERVGYNVLQASDAFQAQDIIRGLSQPIDLLLTDVMMPRMKGTELAQWLKDQIPDIPVLLVSGYTDSSVVQDWVDDDPNVFLAKPFEPEELIASVRSRFTAA